MKAIRHVPITESLSFGWEKTWQHLGFIISFILIGILAQIILGIFQGIGGAVFSQSSDGYGLFSLIMAIVRGVVNVVFGLAGLSAVLQITSNKRPTLGNVFEGVTKVKLIVNYLVMNLLIGIIVTIGFILFIIPGIYLSLKYFFSGYVLVDKRGDLANAMNKSSDITDGVKWELIAFGIVSFMVNVLGFLALGVGLLITIPMTEIARGYVYRHLMRTA